VLKPFKQSVGFQEKHAIAKLHGNQMPFPKEISLPFLKVTTQDRTGFTLRANSFDYGGTFFAGIISTRD
jgi:hypothetical protein